MSYYDDIFNLPHHVSTKHPRMSMYNRAAQFSSFAALTGYEKAIEETRGAGASMPLMEMLEAELLFLDKHYHK